MSPDLCPRWRIIISHVILWLIMNELITILLIEIKKNQFSFQYRQSCDAYIQLNVGSMSNFSSGGQRFSVDNHIVYR